MKTVIRRQTTQANFDDTNVYLHSRTEVNDINFVLQLKSKLCYLLYFSVNASISCVFRLVTFDYTNKIQFTNVFR